MRIFFLAPFPCIVASRLGYLKRLRRKLSIHGGWCKKVADLTGISESMISKFLRFQEEYKRPELKELKLLALGWGRILIAMGISDKNERLSTAPHW